MFSLASLFDFAPLALIFLRVTSAICIIRARRNEPMDFVARRFTPPQSASSFSRVRS